MEMQQRAALGLILPLSAGPAHVQVTATQTPYPIRVTYDSIADSTTRSVEVQRGRSFLLFHLPGASLRPPLAAPKARLEVGGLKVDLGRDQLEAIALLFAPASSRP